ncbi:DUF2189 domain-containing protein [Sediminicoccus sp. KRV36]|uniref:DUF2189 domain-containing protein n=1 Tax=Sediminicoccus sp. KRV36 TaxID=3133721 RepID=UPI00200BAD41|nr:DUF2189 domain-containing protein [Sediminicoccus rosea]UPY37469.1 DUF2189 domain-containing protein [Sediminicoccus rosea]
MSSETTTTSQADEPPMRASRVRRVTTDRPWTWLTLGWRDMMANKPVSLAYGAVLTLGGWVFALLMFEVGTAWAILPATAGFFILAPLLAAGLYETSRRREAGQATTLAEAMGAFRRNPTQIAMMGVLLLVLHLFWVRIAGLLFALFFGLNFAPSLAELPIALLRSDDLLPFLIIGTGFGFVLACVTFAASAVSVPMLVDRQELSFLEAVTVSIQAVMENWRAMALWAGLIVVFIGLALVPFFLGLVIALPLIGHATWHAYRDMVVG